MIDKTFKHSYSAVFEALSARLKEPAPGRIQLLSGPRQVGKTHLLREIESRLTGRVIYAAADTPAAAVTGWWEAQWRAAEDLARAKGAAVLMLDEIQYLPDWARRLKTEYDRIVRAKVPLHVVVTGSSSLRIGQGTKEAMTGRFEQLRLLHWPVRELVRRFGMEGEQATEIAVRFGTYPGAISLVGDPERWLAYVRDAIIEPAIGRDIVAMEVIRKPALLRQVFLVAAGHPAEIISMQKLRGHLADAGVLETIAHYLHVLEEAYLVATLRKYSPKEVRRRAAPPKLIPLNQAFLSAGAAGPPPGPDDAPVWGRWIENACLAHAWNSGQEVCYWRSVPQEVDMVMSGSWGRWAVEVKTGSFTVRDLAGVLEFCRLHRDHRPLVVCDRGMERVARDAGVAAIYWRDFLLEGTPS